MTKLAIANADFTKAVEEEDGAVSLSGIATEELPDYDLEQLDYASSAPLFEAWSERTRDITHGKSLGAVRQQHDATAPVGKLTALVCDPVKKQIRITAKIVDKDCIELIREGILTSFSIGGRYLKKWPDPDNPRLTRYQASPVEISVCDCGSLPTATFELIKSDGSVQLVKGGTMTKRQFHQAMAEDSKLKKEYHAGREEYHTAQAKGEPDEPIPSKPGVLPDQSWPIKQSASTSEFWKSICGATEDNSRNGLE